MNINLPCRGGSFTLLFRLRVVSDLTGFIQQGFTPLTDLSPDLLDRDGSTLNLRHLLALLPDPGLEARHLALLLFLHNRRDR